MARGRPPYDEIMIVNPVSAGGGRRMKLYPIDTDRVAGYVADEPDEISYVADPPPGFVEGYGGGVAYAVGDDEMAYFAEEDEPAGSAVHGPWGEYAYVADEPDEMAWVADDCEGCDGMADDEMAAYGADEDDFTGYHGEYGEDEVAGYYGDDPDAVEGYVRETREPDFSPRVVPVTQLDGYVRPKTINPSVETYRPAEEVPRAATEWFKPLW